jgi:hypothetical protein
MIYKNLLELIDFANNMIKYIESSNNNSKQDVFHSIIYLIYIEDIFDSRGRGLFSDEDGFDLDNEQRVVTKDKITQNMDYIRETIPKLIDRYGRDRFVEEYKQRNAMRAEYWVK